VGQTLLMIPPKTNRSRSSWNPTSKISGAGIGGSEKIYELIDVLGLHERTTFITPGKGQLLSLPHLLKPVPSGDGTPVKPRRRWPYEEEIHACVFGGVVLTQRGGGW